MKNEINLLHTKTKSPLASLAGKLDILRTIAVFFLFLVAILSVTFFFLVLVSPLPTLRREENAKKLALRSLYGKISDLYVINDRIKGVSDVVTKRQQFDKIIGELLTSMPPEMSSDSLTLTEKKVSFTVSSPSLTAFQSYMDTLVEHNKSTNLFTSINQSSLTITPNNEKVSVDITLTF